MRTSTLTCSRCTQPVDPADRSCARCGQPRMGSVVGPGDLRVEHGPPRVEPAEHRPSAVRHDRARRAVPPVVLLASVLLVVAAAVAVVALWLGFSGSSAGPPTAPSAAASTPSAGAAPSADPSASSGSSSGARQTGASLVGSASAQVPATSADAVDGARKKVGYAASNMLDDDPTTAWRMDGDGSGKTVTFTFEEPRTMTTVGLLNGYAKADPATGTDRYSQTRRITRVTWTVGRRRITQELRDGDREAQTVSFPATRTQTVTLRIDAVTTPGDAAFDQTAISQAVLRGE